MADFPKQPGWNEAQQAAALEEYNKVLKETGDIRKASIKAGVAGARAEGETVEQLRLQLELLKDLQTEQKVSLEQKTLEAELRKAEAMAARKEYNTQVQEYRKLVDIRRTAQEDLAAAKKEEAELTAAEIEEYEKLLKKADIDIEKHKELLKAKKEIADATAEEVDNQDELNDAMKLTHRNAENLAGSMANAFAIAGVNNYAKGIYLAVDAMRTAGGWAKLMQRLPEALFSQMISNIVGMSMSIVDMEAGFRKATGASEEFAGAVTKTYDQTRQFGVSAEDASKATQDLYNSYTDFTFLNESTRVELQNTVAVLGEFGIATSDLAQGTQNATKMLGVNVNQVEELHRELFTYAENIGVAPQKMAKEFAAAGPALAKFGNQGVKAFKDLERTAKITGMEMNKILNLTNKFDTFEDAAGMAGKLNAALGGNFVNAMDMMMETDPAARFETIRNAITDAGLSFDTMSYYQKQFYAESLGMSDVGDLALMLSGNMSTLDGANQKSAKEYEVLAAQALEVQKVQDKWNAALAAMTPILTPLISLITLMANGINSMIRPIRAVIAGLLAYFVVTKLETYWDKISVGWKNLRTLSIKDMTKSLWANTLAGKANIWGMIKFVAVIVALGAAMMMKSPSALVIALFALAVAVVALGRASDASQLSLQALAIPIMQLGVGLFLATAGLAGLAGAFAMMDVSQMIGMGVALLILVAAVVAMGIFGVAAAPGIAAVGVAMIPLAGALLAVGAAVGIAAAGVGLMAKGFKTLAGSASGLVQVAAALSKISSAVDEIPTVKAVAVSVMATTLAAASVAAAAAGTVALTTQVTQIAGGALNAPGPVRARGGGGGGGAGGSGLQNVTVKLDADATRALLEGKAASGLAKMAPGFISNNLAMPSAG